MLVDKNGADYATLVTSRFDISQKPILTLSPPPVNKAWNINVVQGAIQTEKTTAFVANPTNFYRWDQLLTVDPSTLEPIPVPADQAEWRVILRELENAKLPGPQGPRGVAGPVGPAGPKGDPGDQGAAVVGPQGPAGPKGDTGAASTVPGPRGPAGADSTVPGPQGPKGDTGATGPASTVPGPAGPKGDTGATGATGAASTVPGPQGPKGDTGATGPAGVAQRFKTTSSTQVTLNGGVGFARQFFTDTPLDATLGMGAIAVNNNNTGQAQSGYISAIDATSVTIVADIGPGGAYSSNSWTITVQGRRGAAGVNGTTPAVTGVSGVSITGATLTSTGSVACYTFGGTAILNADITVGSSGVAADAAVLSGLPKPTASRAVAADVYNGGYVVGKANMYIDTGGVLRGGSTVVSGTGTPYIPAGSRLVVNMTYVGA